MKKNYEEFCNTIIRDLKKMGFEAEMTEVNKLQSPSYEGIIVKEKCSNMGPIVPTKQLYSEYESSNYNTVFQGLIEDLKESIENAQEVVEKGCTVFSDLEEIKKNALIQMVPVKGNEDFLKEVPCKIMEDLAAIVRIKLSSNATAVIRNDNLKLFEISPEQFMEQIISEEPSITFETMGNILASMGFPIMPMESDDFMMYVLSNGENWLGSGVIAYPKILDMAAEKLGGSFYIIPSSIHEVILLPASLIDPEPVVSIIKEVNKSVVSPEERLSDNLYYYDAGKKLFSIAQSAASEKQIKEYTF